MSTFGDFITTTRSQILAGSSFVTTLDNILLTENKDIMTLPTTSFPRVEISIEAAKGTGYNSQRDLQWNFRFWFVGYLKRLTKQDTHDNIWTPTDFLNIWNFGTETMASVMGLLDYKQSHPTELVNFEFFEGYPVLYADCEIMPYISTFMGYVDALFIKGDTDE